MKKTSAFRGVHYQHQKRWVAGCRAANFTKVCHSEMEAVAHYTAVAQTTWPDADSVQKLFEINNPWKGRPTPPKGWDGLGQRVIDIDRDYYAVVDCVDPTTGDPGPDSPYCLFKDYPWFVRDGHALAITACGYDDEWDGWWFEYVSMEEAIFGGPCVHRNGDKLDNRRKNLVSILYASAEEGGQSPPV